MKKLRLLSIVCGMFILNACSILSASQDPLAVAQKMDEEATVATKSLEWLSLKSPPTYLTQAWEALIEGLKDAHAQMDIYRDLHETQESKKVFDEAQNKIKKIQDKVEAFFQEIHDELQKDTMSLDNKRHVLSRYDAVTSDWFESPLGSRDTNYKKIIKGFAKKIKTELEAKQTEMQPKPIESVESKEEKVKADISMPKLDPLPVAHKMDEEARSAAKSLDYLTLETIFSNPAVLKQAWVALIDGLKDTHAQMDIYRDLHETAESKKIFDEAQDKIKNIQTKVVAFFQRIHDELQKDTVSLDIKHKLLSAYDAFTSDWFESPLGTIDVSYKKIVKEFAKKIKAAIAAAESKKQEAEPAHAAPGGPIIPATPETPATTEEKPETPKTGGPLYLAPKVVALATPSAEPEDVMHLAQKITQNIKTALERASQLNAKQSPEDLDKQWQPIMSNLTEASGHLAKYKPMSETAESKAIIKQYENDHATLKQKISKLFADLYTKILKSKNQKLLTQYKVMTEQWMESPQGSKETDYKKTVEGLQEKIATF